MIRTGFFIAFVFHCLQALSHDGVIQGMVRIRSNGEPVQGATVQLLQSRLRTSTDAFGSFVFGGLQPGQYTLAISVLGFKPDTISVSAKAHVTELVNVWLLETAIELAGVVVTHREEDNAQTANRMDIAMRPTRSAQDILRLIPGLVIAQHAGGGKAEQIFLRGFDLDHGTDIALSVDGMPVNMVSHAHGQGYADLHFLIPELVQKVEFNKGPYYARYGDLATAGYANFNTTNTPANMLKVEAGRYNTMRAMGMLSLQNKQLDNGSRQAYIASEYNYSDGYFENPQHFNRFNLMGKYRAVYNDRSILTLSASAFGSKWNASGQIPQRAVDQGIISRFGAIDPNEGGSTSRYNLNLQHTRKFANEAELSNQLYYTRYAFELYSNFTLYLNDTVSGDQIRQKEKRDLAGYRVNYRMHHHSGRTVWTTETGANLRWDKVHNLELSHTLNRSIALEQQALGNVDELNAGAFVSETLEWANKLTVQAALRYDFFHFGYQDLLAAPSAESSRKQQGTLSPKLLASYQIGPRMQLYAKSGIGFHSNDARVVATNPTLATLPQALGVDVGMRWKPSSRLVIDVAAWWLRMQQEFIYVGDEAVVEPGGRSQRTGLDAGLRWQLTNWLYADADINWALPRLLEEPKGANYIPLAPTFTSLGGLTARWGKSWSAAARYRYVADRPANEDNSVTALGYWVADLTGKWQHKRWELGLVVENLFNTEWNEAQFDTESRLKGEPQPVSELHFTPGNPRWVRGYFAYRW
jgi:outer membrane cobalamin receptor